MGGKRRYSKTKNYKTNCFRVIDESNKEQLLNYFSYNIKMMILVIAIR